MKERAYKVVAVLNKDGRKIELCPGPFTHKEACVALRKFTKYPWRREQVEEVPQTPRNT